MISLPRIYPVTDTRISGLTHAEQVRRLADGGATLVQLRDKSASSQLFYQSAVEAVSAAREAGIRIVINDRVDIALAAGADGVHVGQDDLPAKEARKLLGENAIIGYSTHSLKQAVEAVGLPVDYIAIGPVFATSTKANADPTVGLDGVSSVRASIGDFPLVAIGGIDLHRAAEVLSAGADSVAMISELLSDPSVITQRIRQLLTS